MPIQPMFKPQRISEEEFKKIDFQTLRLAFDIQNEMGRFWSEDIYRNELAYRCREAGFGKVDIEVPIKVWFKDFEKTYSIDMLVNDAIIYELKTVEAFTGEHRNQILNYLFLAGLNYGKLINMRPPLVKSEYVSTRISTEKRFDYTIEETAWKTLDEDSAWLKQLLVDLLAEWGAFLDIHLYYDAINHFRGGEENVVKTITALNGERTIGDQKTHLLNDGVAFKITAIIKDQHKHEEQLCKFIRFTSLKAIQWINFNRDYIIFKTIFR